MMVIGIKARFRNCEKGQATTEFAITLLLLLSIILFFIQLCLVFAFGNLTHYATYMAARAYLAAGPTQEDQEERAKDVITRLVKRGPNLAGADRFPFIAKGVGGKGPPGFEARSNSGERDSSWMNGVRYTFRSRLFMIPFAGTMKGNASVNSVTLTSESWLGREPAFDECQKDMGQFPGIWDNGC